MRHVKCRVYCVLKEINTDTIIGTLNVIQPAIDIPWVVYLRLFLFCKQKKIFLGNDSHCVLFKRYSLSFKENDIAIPIKFRDNLTWQSID